MSHRRRTQCPTPGKKPFPCPEAAAAFLRRERGRGRAESDQVYRCSCRSWHVGHLTAALRHRIHRALPTPPQPREIDLREQLSPAFAEAHRMPIRGRGVAG